MKATLTSGVSFLFCLFALSPTWGQILYTQPATDFGLDPQQDTAWLSNVLQGEPDPDRAKVYDNFVLDVDSQIQDLHWTGAFTGLFNQNPEFRGEIDFLVDFYSHDPAGDKPDVSGTLQSFTLDAGLAGINNGTDVQKMQDPTQVTQNGGPVYEYWTDLTPFNLDAGEYWVAIVASQTLPSPHDPLDPNFHVDPLWGWRLGDDGDGNGWQFVASEDPAEPGIQIGEDFAFDITGVPEPSTGLLLLGGLCCLAGGRRKRG